MYIYIYNKLLHISYLCSVELLKEHSNVLLLIEHAVSNFRIA